MTRLALWHSFLLQLLTQSVPGLLCRRMVLRSVGSEVGFVPSAGLNARRMKMFQLPWIKFNLPLFAPLNRGVDSGGWGLDSLKIIGGVRVCFDPLKRRILSFKTVVVFTLSFSLLSN